MILTCWLLRVRPLHVCIDSRQKGFLDDNGWMIYSLRSIAPILFPNCESWRQLFFMTSMQIADLPWLLLQHDNMTNCQCVVSWSRLITVTDCFSLLKLQNIQWAFSFPDWPLLRISLLWRKNKCIRKNKYKLCALGSTYLQAGAEIAICRIAKWLCVVLCLQHDHWLTCPKGILYFRYSCPNAYITSFCWWDICAIENIV